MSRTHVPWRPASLSEFIGQEPAKKRLSMRVRADIAQCTPLPHMLLYGPPGTGKTTLAELLAHERGCAMMPTTGYKLQKRTDVWMLLKGLPLDGFRREDERLVRIPGIPTKPVILFVDEIQGISNEAAELLYRPLEDAVWPCTATMNGVRDQFIYWDLPPFTLIGAATDAGDLPQPLVDRLKTHIYMEPYTPDEMRRITASHAAKAIERAEEIASENSGTTFYPRIWNEGAIEAISIRSRSTPRIAASLVAEVASWAVVERASVVGTVLVDRVMAALGIDECGLGELDRRIMRTLAAVGKPVGIEALAAMLHDTRNNIAMAERYLMSLGAIHRTARGRELTKKGTEMVAGWDGERGDEDAEDTLGDLTMLREMVGMIDDEDDEFEAPAMTAAATVTTKDPWAAARDPNLARMPGSM